MKKEECRTILKILTGKEHVKFTSRGNESIKLALKIVKNLGKEICLLQDEGGWMYYEKFIIQNELEPIRLTTNYGLIFEKELKHYSHDSALLLNSMAGYIALHDMSKVHTTCIADDIILINDVSGSIGTNEAKFGDIIIGSFGEGKPINAGKGGFIAVDDPDLINDVEDITLDFNLLEQKLKNINNRRKFLIETCNKIKNDLNNFDIVHKEHDGLDVVVKFSSEEEKNKIIQYCDKNNYEYTICPREIRIMEDAISIEVKRLIE